MERNGKRKGRLFVISAPSGTGKTTLCRLLMDAFKGISYSVSHTTRKPRDGEVHGKDYYFVSVSDFEQMIRDGALVEWAKVHDNYYGTSLAFITDSLENGQDILLDIDVQGAANIRAAYPEAVTIFIMPPSLSVLKERLERRGTDKPEVIETRLKNAVAEMAQKELYGHVIVNDRLETARDELFDLVRSCLEP